MANARAQDPFEFDPSKLTASQAHIYPGIDISNAKVEMEGSKLVVRFPPNTLEEGLGFIYKRDEKRRDYNPPSEESSDGLFVKYLKKLLIVIAAVITAFPTMINAGLSAFGIRASDVNLDVWRNASIPRRSWFIVLTTSTFALNWILAFTSLPLAFAQLFNKKTWRDNPYRSFFALIFGFAGAASLFAVAMQTMAFSMTMAWYMAIASFCINFAVRLVNANNSLRRGQNQLTDEKIHLQQRYIRLLKRLKPEFLTKLNKSLFKTITKIKAEGTAANGTLTSDPKKNPNRFYGLLLVALDRKAGKLMLKYEKTPQDQDIELAPLISEDHESVNDTDLELQRPAKNIKKVDSITDTSILHPSTTNAVLTTGVDLTIGGIVALAAYIIFELKGENALGYIFPKATADMDAFERILAGFFPGSASLLVYFLSGWDFRTVLLASLANVYNSPNRLKYVTLAAMLAATALSGANMYNVGNVVAQDKMGLFATILAHIEKLFPWIAAEGGALVNGKNALMEYFPAKLQLEFKENDDIVAAVIKVFGNTGVNVYKEVENKFPEAFISYLNSQSLFARQKSIISAPPSPMQRNRSTIFTGT